MRHVNRVLMAAVACVFLLATLTGVAIAQGIVGEKLRSGATVTIPAGETVSNDVYAFAGTVRVDGTVDGDLIASGGRVDITGTVTGDVLAAGGSVNITGTVNGDTRIAGGTLSVGGAIKEDLVAAGGQLTITPSGTVGGDVIAGTGQLTIDVRSRGMSWREPGRTQRRARSAGRRTSRSLPATSFPSPANQGQPQQ